MKYSIFTILIIIAILPIATYGQNSTDELSLLLASGTIEFTRVNGNGSSSGASIDAIVQNNSLRTVRPSVNLIPPLYFQNEGGTGQNMIATQVYLEGGGYYSDEEDSYIELPPNSSTRLMIIAYCADFEKDNPMATDSFTVSALPQELVEIAWRVASYESDNPNTDVTVAAQVAIWLAQGESADDIQEMFSFSASDERLARQFLR